MLLATAVFTGVPLFYFAAEDSDQFSRLALLAVTLLGAALAILAAGILFITQSLQQRIARLEDREEGPGPVSPTSFAMQKIPPAGTSPAFMGVNATGTAEPGRSAASPHPPALAGSPSNRRRL